MVTFRDIVGDTVRALEQCGAEAAMTSLWSQPSSNCSGSNNYIYIYIPDIYKPEMRHSGIPVGGEKVVVYIRHKRLPQTTN